jgi:hypothetical protein
MTNPAVETRRETVKKLVAAGVHPEAAEWAADTPSLCYNRHQSRVAAALQAAKDWLLEQPEEYEEGERLTVAAQMLCWAEGVGYVPGGGGGPSTNRHPAFCRLGTGRRFASDGGAWSAAIEAAAGGISPVVKCVDYTDDYGKTYHQWMAWGGVGGGTVGDGWIAHEGWVGLGSELEAGGFKLFRPWVQSRMEIGGAKCLAASMNLELVTRPYAPTFD